MVKALIHKEHYATQISSATNTLIADEPISHGGTGKGPRIHDFRHSHISLLIEMGFTPVDIAKRVGHENINITMHYAHMFPQKQDEMIDKLENKNNLLEEEISWTDTKKKKE